MSYKMNKYIKKVLDFSNHRKSNKLNKKGTSALEMMVAMSILSMLLLLIMPIMMNPEFWSKAKKIMLTVTIIGTPLTIILFFVLFVRKKNKEKKIQSAEEYKNALDIINTPISKLMKNYSNESKVNLNNKYKDIDMAELKEKYV